MRGVNFRIFPDGRQWGWSVLGAGGKAFAEGQARTRAEAAACVIREAIRSVVPAEQSLTREAA